MVGTRSEVGGSKISPSPTGEGALGCARSSPMDAHPETSSGLFFYCQSVKQLSQMTGYFREAIHAQTSKTKPQMRTREN